MSIRDDMERLEASMMLPQSQLYGAIDEHVKAIMCAEQRTIEWAIERAVQMGDRGVKVVRRDGMMIECAPDESVPYGYLHEHLLAPAPLGLDETEREL